MWVAAWRDGGGVGGGGVAGSGGVTRDSASGGGGPSLESGGPGAQVDKRARKQENLKKGVSREKLHLRCKQIDNRIKRKKKAAAYIKLTIKEKSNQNC